MANFHTHLSVAALGSMTATAVCIQKVGLHDEQAAILFILGCLGGMLPDIDSDHSTPATWFFRLLTLSSLILVGSWGYTHMPPVELALWLVLTFLCVHFIVSALIRRITVHRGLFHSIPAALLAGMFFNYVGFHMLHWSAYFAMMAAFFVSGGYLLHLLLDETYSVDLLGGRLKSSFGSAMTLFNRQQWKGYLVLYLLVAFGLLSLPSGTGFPHA